MKFAIAIVLITIGGCLSRSSAQMASQSDDESAAAPSLPRQTYGIIDGDTYVSPRGIYRIKIPVLHQLGGEISDTPNVVTFDDDYSARITVAAFPLSPELKSEFDRRGRQGFSHLFFHEDYHA